MILLHGENIIASRQKLKESIVSFEQKKTGEVLKFEGNNLSLINLKQALSPLSLIGGDKLIVIENLFGGRKSKEKEKVIDFLKKENPEGLIVWEGKKIDGRLITSFKSQTLKFDLPVIIFRFLDALLPDNSRMSLNLFHQCLAQDPPEIIFYMMIKHFRLLIIAADLGSEGLGKMDSWRQEKIINQAKKFGLNRLLQIYRQFLEIDWRQKTGKAPFDLISELDLLLASF
jgi:DNA polymerase III delta subunit